MKQKTIKTKDELRRELGIINENIIINLLRRSQYDLNEAIYLEGGIHIPEFKGSFLDFLLIGREILDASAGRYDCRVEHPFFSQSANIQKIVIRRDKNECEEAQQNKLVNRNEEVKSIYLQTLRDICKPGNQDEEYGSITLLDIDCLQEMSKRVHYGEFVAEAKYVENEKLRELVRKEDWKNVKVELKDIAQEEAVLGKSIAVVIVEKLNKLIREANWKDILNIKEKEQRKLEIVVLDKLELISKTQFDLIKKQNSESNETREEGIDKITPEFIRNFFNKLISLTIDVEVEYLQKYKQKKIFESFSAFHTK